MKQSVDELAKAYPVAASQGTESQRIFLPLPNPTEDKDSYTKSETETTTQNQRQKLPLQGNFKHDSETDFDWAKQAGLSHRNSLLRSRKKTPYHSGDPLLHNSSAHTNTGVAPI